MVELCFDRTDSGSVATVLVGDAIVVRVHGLALGSWIVEDHGLLTLEASEQVDGKAEGETLFRFRAAVVGKSTLRLALRGANACTLDSLVLVVAVNDDPPSTVGRLLKKRH